MGMSIEELVETAQKYSCIIVTKDMWSTAVASSHKLQKIEQIVKSWKADVDIDSYDCMSDIYMRY